MLARLVRTLPEGPDWEYELKLDGYRPHAIKDVADYTWLRPEIEAEIKFTERTQGGVLRLAEFVSLRQA